MDMTHSKIDAEGLKLLKALWENKKIAQRVKAMFEG